MDVKLRQFRCWPDRPEGILATAQAIVTDADETLYLYRVRAVADHLGRVEIESVSDLPRLQHLMCDCRQCREARLFTAIDAKGRFKSLVESAMTERLQAQGLISEAVDEVLFRGRALIREALSDSP